mmetsp:Transcript_37670/g.90158  ORF Transcript_37670/g.90158 Transcript_37670/m.90158 type:complete len:213 (+) Transcript_37670:666-1304(+)
MTAREIDRLHNSFSCYFGKLEPSVWYPHNNAIKVMHSVIQLILYRTRVWFCVLVLDQALCLSFVPGGPLMLTLKLRSPCACRHESCNAPECKDASTPDGCTHRETSMDVFVLSAVPVRTRQPIRFKARPKERRIQRLCKLFRYRVAHENNLDVRGDCRSEVEHCAGAKWRGQVCFVSASITDNARELVGNWHTIRIVEPKRYPFGTEWSWRV